MDADGLKPIVSDLDHYTKSFHVYAPKCNKFAGLARWGDEVFPKLVLERLVENFTTETEIKMLGVGSGSGEMDSKMASILKSSFNSICNVVVDPASLLLKMYRSLISRKSDELQGIEFDLCQLSIDEFRSKQGDQNPKYHFISAIHSVYYAENFTDTVKYLYDCLEDGGILLIVIISDISGFWRVWENFAPFRRTVPYFCVNHLRQVLASLSIPFEESRQRSRVDITSCFGEASEEGDLIVDFLTQMVDLRGSVSAEFYKDVMDFIRSDRCSEQLKDGTILFNNDWDAIMVQKPLSK